MSGRLWHSEDSMIDPSVVAGSSQIERLCEPKSAQFHNPLRDFTIFLLGQPCHSRTFEQVLSYSRPGSGFHMQGQFIPGGANSTGQQMCLYLQTPWLPHSPSKLPLSCQPLFQTGTARSVRSMCGLLIILSPLSGTQLVFHKCCLVDSGWLGEQIVV